MELPRLAVRDLHDGQTEAPEDFEIDAGVAPDLRDTSDQEDRDVHAALRQRARDDEAVAAVVAAAAEHRDLPLEEIAVHRLHRRHDLSAGVLHQDERGDADVFDRAAIRLAHLGRVQDAHRQPSQRGINTMDTKDTKDCRYGVGFVSIVSFVLDRRVVPVVRSAAMAATVNVNGRVSDQEHAVISIFDHGFLYGEGVYETLRTYNGQSFLFDRHMRRMRNSAPMLAPDTPLTDAQIDDRFQETVRAAGLGGSADREAYIRILVTRGIGELTYDPAATPVPSIVVIVKPNVDPPRDAFENGVKVSLVGVVRNHPGTVNPLIKSNSLLNNALAMQEALRRGAFEGVMRNYKGELAECTQSNLFIVKNGAALTPPIDAGLLPGITREFLFEVGAEAGIPVREQVLRDTDLFDADESFLTSTTREVVPIVQVDDRRIGNGKPGPVTTALLDAYRRKAEALTRTASATIG